MAFTAYGSLVPFDYHPKGWDAAVAEFDAALIGWRDRPLSLSDFAANVALGVPLGFAMLAAMTTRRRWESMFLAAPVVLFGGLFAAAVEFSQLFFNRVCAGSDVIAQSLGTILGTVLWIGCGRWAVERLRGTVGVAPLLFGYAVVVLVALTMPLDLTASPKQLYERLHPPTTTWVPLGEVFANPNSTTQSDLKAAVGWVELFALFLPGGVLLGGLPGKYRTANGLVSVAGWGLLAAGVGEAAQVLVVSRHPSVTDVLVGGLAVVAGWVVGRVLAEKGVRKHRPEVAAVLGQAWSAVIAVIAWQPFTFFPAIMRERLGDMSWLPLREKVGGHYLWSLEDLIGQMVRFGVLGAIVTWGLSGRGKRASLWPAVLVAALVAVMIELGQAMVPGRTVSPTDVLIAAVGGWIGAAVMRRAAEPAPTVRKPTGVRMTSPRAALPPPALPAAAEMQPGEG